MTRLQAFWAGMYVVLFFVVSGNVLVFFANRHTPQWLMFIIAAACGAFFYYLPKFIVKDKWMR